MGMRIINLNRTEWNVSDPSIVTAEETITCFSNLVDTKRPLAGWAGWGGHGLIHQGYSESLANGMSMVIK